MCWETIRMRIWVTRPLDDAQAMKAHLIARGHEAFIEPLINVQYGCEDPIDLEDAQCLVATSRNGVRALAQAPEFEYARLLPLFAVGPGTATVAKALGFMDVMEGPGRANELVDVICERAGVNSGPIVCLLGDHKAFDLPGELVRLGFQVFAPIIYHTSAAASLSGALVARLERGEIDSVLLLSPRTATDLRVISKTA